MKYLVVYAQAGGGCDHTIGCGVSVEIIEATGDADVERQIGDALYSEGGLVHEECEIASVRYVPLSAVTDVDLEALYEPFGTAKDAASRAASDASEREQYERLRAKFGGS